MFVRLALALCAGLALWLSFPGWDFWFLAPVGIALLALAVRGQGIKRAFLLGWVCGLAFFLTLLSWTAIFVGPIALVPLAVAEALFIGTFAALVAAAQRLARAPGERLPVRPMAVACLWLLTEHLRARLPFGGFPWGRLAFSQADSPMLAVVSLLGAPGLSLLVALVGGLLAAGIGHWWAVRAPQPRHPSLQCRDGLSRWLAAREILPGRPGVVVALTAAAGLIVVPVLVPRPTSSELPPVDVAMVQGNVPEVRLEFNAQRRAVLDNHLRATDQLISERAAGERPAPDLVLWPENASDIDPLRNADVVRLLRGQVDRLDAPLVLGAVLREPAPRVSNTVLVYVPGEGPVARYTKQRPVPFGEYIPYRGFFRLFTDQVDNVRSDFAPGTEPGLLTVPTSGHGPVPMATGICFEVADDAVLREGVLLGGQVIYLPTNNATFGFTDESVQQLAISRLRAVEHGRTVLHISNVGVSGFVLPDGTVRQPTSLYEKALLQAQVPRRTSLTIADRLGPWPERFVVWGTGGAVLVLLGRALLARVERRVRADKGSP